MALYYLSPSLWLAVPAVLGFLAIAWWRLDCALACTLFTVPFYLFPKTFDPQSLGLDRVIGRTEALQVSLTEFAVLACFIAWSSCQLYSRYRSIGATAPVLPLAYLGPPLALFATALLSLLFSEYLRFSLREFRVVILEPLLFFFMIADTVRRPEQAAMLLNSFVALGAAVAIAALYHYFFIGTVEATGGVKRILAVYHSPNALALFLGRVIPVAVALSLYDIRSRAMGYGSLRYLTPAILMAFVLFLTYSRGAWAGVLAAVVFIAVVSSRKWALAGLGGLALMAGIALASPDRALALAPIVQRIYIWQAAIEMVRDHPITGVGLDNFLYHYPRYMLPDAWAEPNVSHPHNLLLDFWLRLGILGVAAMTWTIVSFWKGAWRLYQTASGFNKVAGLALMASMVDFLVHGTLDNSFFLVDLTYVFWFSYALVAALSVNLDQSAGQASEAS